MKKILDTLKLKWAEYLLEVVVIVIGILGAFALNNWNDQRVTLKQKQVYISSLKSDLLRDVQSIMQTLEIQTADQMNIEALANDLSNPKISFKESVGLIMNFNRAIVSLREFNTSTFDALISTGKIDILNNELINAIRNLSRAQNQFLDVDGSLIELYRSKQVELPWKNSIINSGPLFDEIKKDISVRDLMKFNDHITLKRQVYRHSINALNDILSQTQQVLVLLDES